MRRTVERQVIERFIECGDPHHGFARIYCARPGLILFVQTFGDLANFNPHVHVLAADGAFLADGTFVALPAVPEALLAEGFRRAVLRFLAQTDAISEDLRSKLLGWRYSGFSAHNQVRVGGDDAEGRKKLAGYMLRAPMSLEKMSYDAETGTVIYRSRMHAGLKRNFQVMPGAEWLELLCRHIPDRYEHLVRYVGWYSNRARGERAKALQGQETMPTSSAAPVEPVSEFAARAKAAWARLIRKVYEADPLECPKCKGPMRVIALIDDPGVVRRILEHLGRSRARGERARPARAAPRVAGKRRHSPHVSPPPRHRVALCEEQEWPPLLLAPYRRPTVALRRAAMEHSDITCVANRASRPAECPHAQRPEAPRSTHHHGERPDARIG